MHKKTILEIKNLRVDIKGNLGWYSILNNINFKLFTGETLCIVGESGCGKTFTALSIMKLLPEQVKIKGNILFQKKDLISLPDQEMRKIRGKEISMVFQDPLTSLNPVFTIYQQIGEMILAHTKIDKHSLKQRCIQILKEVNIPDPETKLFSYPHQLSGGQRQRILIGMAIALSPKIIIADEPTTALDVTVQAKILKLFNRLKREMGLSAIYITHDLSVVSEVGDRIIIMYSGTIMEQGPKHEILFSPKHPYTKGLINSMPSYEKKGQHLSPIPGYVPGPDKRPDGCPFHPRCKYKKKICSIEIPKLKEISKDHLVRCHLIY